MTNAMSASSSSPPNNQNQQEVNKKKWLIVDFDGTCTIQDTTPLLAHLTSLVQQRSKKESNKDYELRRSRFNKMEERYFDLYEQAKQKVFASLQQNNDDEKMSLKQALDTLDDASNTVTQQISSSGILRGLIQQQHRSCSTITKNKQMSDVIAHYLDTDAQCKDTVTLHDNCIQVLAAALQKQRRTCWTLGVLSINWCPPLIDAALLRHVRRQSQSKTSQDNDGGDFETKEGEHFPVWSNEVNHEGIVHLHVPGASAKMECIASLRRTNSYHTRTKEVEQSDKNKNDTNDASPIVYIGDSSTDLLALLEADVGILFVPSSSSSFLVSHLTTATTTKTDNENKESMKYPTVIQIAKHYNVVLKPLSEYISYFNTKKEDEMGNECEKRHDMKNGQHRIKKTTTMASEAEENCIWITDTWEEIGLFLDNFQ